MILQCVGMWGVEATWFRIDKGFELAAGVCDSTEKISAVPHYYCFAICT